MAESGAKGSGVNVIRLGEEHEVIGNEIGSKNFRFSKIGEAVPINSDEYDPQNFPACPLAVSEKFGVIFIAHSNGFYVARTKEVMRLAEELGGESEEKLKEEGKSWCIEELSVVDVNIGKVSILTLSADSSTLAACIGGDLHFFSVAALLNKKKEPSFSCSVNDSTFIKDMRWCTRFKDHYVVLSGNGTLYFGAGQDGLKNVMDDVDAVEWSSKGKHVAVARNYVLSILSSKFKEELRIMLSFDSWVGDSGTSGIVKVDSIRWVRPDCIIIGCYQLTEEGKEENYLVQVITCKDGKLEACSNPVVMCFSDVFLHLSDDAVPYGSGPHIFSSYLVEYELAFLANRKNVEEHIKLFGWSVDEKDEATLVEILKDAYCPRLHYRENGDNLLLGLAVDKVSIDEEVKFVIGETDDEEVSPCCILLCVTVDGKLSVFYFASATDPLVLPEVSDEEEEEEDHHPSEPSENQSKLAIDYTQQRTDEVRPGLQPKEVKVVKELDGKGHNENSIRTEDKEEKYVAGSKSFEGTAKGEVPVAKAFQDRDGKQPLSLQKQGGSLEGTLLRSSQPEGPRREVRETQERGDVKSSADFVSKLSAEEFNKPLFGDLPKASRPGAELQGQIRSTSALSPSSGSWPTGFSSSSRTSDVKSSPLAFNGFQGAQAVSSASTAFPSGTLQSPPFLMKTSGTSTSANLLGHVASTGAGITNSRPVVHSGQFTVQKSSDFNFHSDKGPQRIRSPPGKQNSQPNLPEQFRSVEDMAKELDTFLENIERPGGFYDASVTLQKASVTELDQGISALSSRCRKWKGIMDHRLEEIQLLHDKMVEVLTRKQYMEGIVKQATDRKYWDLWDRQKLSSELELKQRHILEMNQNLTNQLIELERHLNALELKRFGESDSVQTNRRSFQSKHGPSRHVQSLLSLRSTMNAQLAAAEQLSECLSKQMSILNIEPEPVKKQSIKEELFETIGISYDSASVRPPDEEKLRDLASSRKLLISSASPAAKSQSTRRQSSAAKSSEPETARRRRDSLDRNWASFNPPKTTVKRILLQDNRQVSPSRLSFSNDKEHLNDRLMDGTTTSHNIQSRISSTVLYPSENRGSWNTPMKISSEGLPSSFQRTATDSDLPKSSRSSSVSLGFDFQSSSARSQNNARDTRNSTVGGSNIQSILSGKSDSVALSELNTGQQAESYLVPLSTISTGLPARTQTLPEKSFEFPDSRSKDSTPTTGQRPLKPENLSFWSTKILETPSFTVPSASTRAPSLFAKGNQLETPSTKGQHHEVVSSSSMPSLSIPVLPQPSTSFVFKDTALAATSMPVSRVATSSEAKMDNQIISVPGTGSSISSFLSSSLTTISKETVPSSSIPSASPVKADLNTPKTDVSKFNLERIDSSAPQIISKPMFSSSPDKSSVPQASPLRSTGISSPSGLEFKQSTLPESPASLPLNPKPEEPPSVEPLLSTISSSVGEKNDSSDVAFTQEDEMEEEAPETTQLTLGNLGGFGLGSAPNPAVPKPNPFGASFGNTTTNPPIPAFTMTQPSGGLFRPASFSIQSPQISQPSQQTNLNAFSGGFGTAPTDINTAGKGFGQPAQIGSGQKALGTVLGAFGQSRQLGAGLPGSSTTPNPFGSGFGSNQPNSGFSSAPTSGGFASLASAGGGFGSLATAGGGFAAAATASGGFAAAATAGGGFASAATGVGGFSAAASGGGFSSGGFGGFANQGGGGGFSGFGSSGVAARPPSELFTQMRK